METRFVCSGCGDLFDQEPSESKREYCDKCLAREKDLRDKLNNKEVVMCKKSPMWNAIEKEVKENKDAYLVNNKIDWDLVAETYIENNNIKDEEEVHSLVELIMREDPGPHGVTKSDTILELAKKNNWDIIEVDQIIAEEIETNVLMDNIQGLLNMVNKVTGQHRHGLKVSTRNLDNLCNRQLDFESYLEELKNKK